MTDTVLGADPPIEKVHPGLQPALVFASYPLTPIVLISVMAVYYILFRSGPADGKNTPAQVKSTR